VALCPLAGCRYAPRVHSSRWVLGVAMTLGGLGAALGFAACGSSSSPVAAGGTEAGRVDSGGSDTSDSGAPSLDTGVPIFNTEAGDVVASADASCEPPDLLIVLDRSLSMAQLPSGTGYPPKTDAGYLETKWYLAGAAIGDIVMAPNDETTFFGLELLPKAVPISSAPDASACYTVDEARSVTAANLDNVSCEPGEVVVLPGAGNGAAITGAIQAAPLCGGTPLGAALTTAQTTLQALATGGRKRYVLIVTDGEQSPSCLDASVGGGSPVTAAQSLAAAGIETYVVGFGAQAGVADLNDIACAGMTASSFATSCVKRDGAAGYVTAPGVTTPLFYAAADGAALETALKGIAVAVCSCGCAQ